MTTREWHRGRPSRAAQAARTLLAAACVAVLGLAAGSLAAPAVDGGEPGRSTEGPACAEGLPPGHPPIGTSSQLPPGHPPVGRLLALPPGHPPVRALPNLPAGHPPVPASPVPLPLFPQQRTVTI
jgi:hypothetical protein